ncbi:uncharacterized protein LOC131019881 [Salvia miltiorrhiza]|uniref:uncharacterized protein LOC131019881 n=1 Tax=Salvia miltiorrhiza TaxID=226208 RepID=UPI0025AB9968|nr:uncharacterized protein LOC131019881 [Salvia miltiorrhiza]
MAPARLAAAACEVGEANAIWHRHRWGWVQQLRKPHRLCISLSPSLSLTPSKDNEKADELTFGGSTLGHSNSENCIQSFLLLFVSQNYSFSMIRYFVELNLRLRVKLE